MAEQMASLPSFRISTFGGFSLERLTDPSSSGQEAHYEALPKEVWKRRQVARSVLKVLLCRDHRQVTKDELLELFWSEASGQNASRSLDTALSVLRTVLCPPQRESLLRTIRSSDATLLTLAKQEDIWVDADAFERLLAEATRAEQYGRDPLPLLEQAHQLARGTFLEEDIYSDWTHARRHILSNAQHRLLYRLTDLYLQRNMQEQAEVLLQTFHAQEPTNEDALCRLMTLLAQLGRPSEALHCYEQTVRQLWEELEVEPQRKTRQLAEQIRQQTAPLKSFTHLAPIKQASFSAHSPISRSRAQIVETLLVETPETIPEQESEYLARGIGYLQPLFHKGWSPHSILDVLHIVLPVVDALPEAARQSLFPMDARVKNGSFLHQKQVSDEQRTHLHLALSESVVSAWKLFLSASSTQILTLGQLQLACVQRAHPLLHPYAQPFLYAGVYGLIGIALHFQERDKEALQAHYSSHMAARATNDPWYIAQSLICQADCYHALQQYDFAIQTIKEAVEIVGIPQNGVLACTMAHLLTCWADSAMMLEDYKSAQEKLEASQVYLDHIPPNLEFDRTGWLLLAGKYALRTKNYMRAKQHFEDALTNIPEQWMFRRIMAALGLTKAYAHMKERYQSLVVAEEIVPLIQIVDAQMINRWLIEYLQHDLLDVFPTDEQVRVFVTNIYKRLPQLTTLYG